MHSGRCPHQLTVDVATPQYALLSKWVLQRCAQKAAGPAACWQTLHKITIPKFLFFYSLSIPVRMTCTLGFTISISASCRSNSLALKKRFDCKVHESRRERSETLERDRVQASFVTTLFHSPLQVLLMSDASLHAAKLCSPVFCGFAPFPLGTLAHK